MGWFSSFFSDPIGTVVNTVENVGSSIDDFVNDEIPGGWVTVGAVTGAALLGPELLAEEALAGDAAAGAADAELGSDLLTTGLDMGDTIPFTAQQVEGLYPIESTFTPMEGIDMGETIPFTPEQVEGLYPENGAFLPEGYTGTEGLDTGEVIPYTEEQIAGLYPPGDTFTPIVPVEDLSTAAVGTLGGGGLADTLTGAAIGGAAGAAAGSAIENVFTPNVPGGTSTATPTSTNNPNWDIKFSPHTQWKDAPTFDWNFSDTPVPYLESSQLLPQDLQTLGVGNAPYSSELIQALRAASAGPASNNSGFTQYQTAVK